jgi:hypothetical protein
MKTRKAMTDNGLDSFSQVADHKLAVPGGRSRGTAGIRLAVVIVLGLAVPGTHAASPAQSWEARAHGVHLSLTQILPDQVRGFYGARGFAPDAVELMATRHCFFQTVLRNESAGVAIHFNLREWKVHASGTEQPLKLVADWLPEWERRGVSEPARTAFRWALFPAEQSYEVGDWNMGMITLAHVAGGRFDLRAQWHENNERRETTLRGVRCATDTGRKP